MLHQSPYGKYGSVNPHLDSNTPAGFGSAQVTAASATIRIGIFDEFLLRGLKFFAQNLPAAGESMTLDVLLNGTSILTAPYVYDSSATQNHDIDLPLLADLIVPAGSFLTYVRTYVAGGGPTPIGRTIIATVQEIPSQICGSGAKSPIISSSGQTSPATFTVVSAFGGILPVDLLLKECYIANRTAAADGESYTLDILVNGVSVLASPVLLNSSIPPGSRTAVPVISPLALAGQVCTINSVYTAGPSPTLTRLQLGATALLRGILRKSPSGPLIPVIGPSAQQTAADLTSSAVIGRMTTCFSEEGIVSKAFFTVDNPAASGETMSYRLRKNGSIFISDAFIFDDTMSNRELIEIPMTPTHFEIGDFLEVIRDYTAGGGPTPIGANYAFIQLDPIP